MHTCTHALISYCIFRFLSDSNWGPFQQQISFPTTKLTFLHPYRTRSNERIMDQFEQNQAALRRDMDVMGERMTQLMETLHVVVQGQEELRKSVVGMVKDTPTNSADEGVKTKEILVEGIPKVVDDHHEVIDLEHDLTAELTETAKMYQALEERLKAEFQHCCSMLGTWDCDPP